MSWLDELLGVADGSNPQANFDTSQSTLPYSTDVFGALTQALGGGTGPGEEALQLPSANENDNGAFSEGLGGGPSPLAAEKPGALSQLMKGLGLQDKSGNVDLSNPDTLNKIMKLVNTGGGIVNSLMNQGATRGYQSPASLQAALSSPFSKWNPQQQSDANKYFGGTGAGIRNQSAPGSLPSPVVAGKRYAEGGMVDDDNPTHISMGALSSLVQGHGGGQDDLVPARLSPGEYVVDADAVSALGDGSNEHGAKKLDAWRESLRKHKRSAPPHSIPPKAKAPQDYLKQVKVK